MNIRKQEYEQKLLSHQDELVTYKSNMVEYVNLKVNQRQTFCLAFEINE